MVQVPPRHAPRPGDGWVECGCGRRHWGLVGAAGLLLARRDDAGTITHVLLQHRALWSDQGGTWGVPGGAREPGETAVQGALREAAEEAGVDPGDVEVVDESVLTHPDWSYTTVIGFERAPVAPRATDAESLEVAWVPVDEVPGLPLLPAFAQAWPMLLTRAVAAAPTRLGTPD
ncbi:MAG: NUDIX domain-containing protein [Actinobacteria bacterium]|nr:NUDIX domain-containing protein [Actinomycetota bacterium]MCG2801655.1 NUDIX domain-containing protein [Cellulomonas sp.]